MPSVTSSRHAAAYRTRPPGGFLMRLRELTPAQRDERSGSIVAAQFADDDLLACAGETLAPISDA